LFINMPHTLQKPGKLSEGGMLLDFINVRPLVANPFWTSLTS